MVDLKAGFPLEKLLPMVSFADRAAAPAHVLVRFLDREAVLLNLETEQYFGLDETGTRMWQLMTASPNIDAAYQELLAEFDVQPELLRGNLTELLSRLVDSGLLQVLPADVETVRAV
jgi:hypothetical protein